MPEKRSVPDIQQGLRNLLRGEFLTDPHADVRIGGSCYNCQTPEPILTWDDRAKMYECTHCGAVYSALDARDSGSHPVSKAASLVARRVATNWTMEGVPIEGGFDNGCGTFLADSILDGDSGSDGVGDQSRIDFPRVLLDDPDVTNSGPYPGVETEHLEDINAPINDNVYDWPRGGTRIAAGEDPQLAVQPAENPGPNDWPWVLIDTLSGEIWGDYPTEVEANQALLEASDTKPPFDDGPDTGTY